MAQILAGPGVLLPPPQALYPPSLQNLAYTAATNKFSLSPAQAALVPAGQWLVSVTGVISALQWLDPVRLEWVNLLGPGAAWSTQIKSDGVNFRVVN